VYTLVIEAGLHKASSIKVAEAAKIIENTQRDLNIALMNELSMIFDKMGINTYDVLDAAGTKWNFQKFQPGLVGGHCIGVDPYYLTYKASELGHHAKVILAGRAINDNMGSHIGQTVLKRMISAGKAVTGETNILIMGITFKENVMDIRNSKVADLYEELVSFNVKVDVVDPFADPEEVMHEYGIALTPQGNIRNDYSAVIVAVAHDHYTNLTEDNFSSMTTQGAVLADLKGLYRKSKFTKLTYWSL
jgi:UDP-N-acetyl-D-glucosamine/UDP-N-acetyl-D-galactosamine dehydrogenase